MRRIFRQGGFLLIVGAILIIIGALLATVVTFLFVARSESGIEHLGGAQALFLAESGREQALRGLVVDNTYCSSVSYPNVSFGAGNFSASAAINISARIELGSAVAATDSVIPVSSTSGFAAHGRIRIAGTADEEINYAALSTSCAPFASPACFTGAWRGVAGTTASSHAINASVSQEQCLIRSVGSVPGIGSQRTIETARRFIPAMMVYSKNTTIPYYRLWEGTAWGPERSALAVNNNIRFMVLRHARTRNEAVLGTVDQVGQLVLQVWNGSSWGNQLVADDTAQTTRRAFDIAYETVSDRALVVHGRNGTSNGVITRIWNGSSWTTGANANLASIAQPRWVRLAPHPTSNDIALIASGDAPAVYGTLWVGANWSSITTPDGNWDTGISTTTQEGIGVAYEQVSGEALFIWGDSTSRVINRRTWDGTTLGATTAFTLTVLPIGAAGAINWVQLAADSYSDRILIGVQAAGSAGSLGDMATVSWTGTAMQAQTLMDGATEAVEQRGFDIVYETHPSNAGRAWFVWGNGTNVSARSGSVVSGTWTWGGTSTITNTVDTGYVRAFAHPRTGSVFAGFYEISGASTRRDIYESHLTLGGSTWSDAKPIWVGTTGAAPQYQRVDISASRFLPRVDWPEIFR